MKAKDKELFVKIAEAVSDKIAEGKACNFSVFPRIPDQGVDAVVSVRLGDIETGTLLTWFVGASYERNPERILEMIEAL